MNNLSIIFEIFPTISQEMVIILNRTAQLVGIIFGIQTLYEIHSYKYLKKYFDLMGKLKNYLSIVVTKNQFTIGLNLGKSSIPHEPQLNTKVVFILTIIIIAVFFFTNSESPFYWYLYPFLKFSSAFTIWNDVELNSWTILTLLIRSILLILWSFVSLTLIISLGLIIPAKSISILSNKIAEKLSNKIYRFILLLELLFSGIVLFITS
ncbi:MAG: hypothetical protein Q8N03_18095 [Ignavibacteria bacterium]|nr:hypothetical protein [Ignavibacteria bacterium]